MKRRFSLVLALFLLVASINYTPIVHSNPTFPSVRSKDWSVETSASTHTVDLPPTIEAGDTLIVFFACDDNEAVTFPGDWTVIYDEDAGGNGPTLTIAWLEAVGDEDGTTISVETGSSEASAHLSWSIQDADDPDDNPPEASAEASGSSSNPNSVTLTPGGGEAEYLWLTIMANDDGRDIVTSYPLNCDDNQENRVSSDVGTGVGIGIASNEFEGIAFNPSSFTIENSEEWDAVTVAVYPSPISGVMDHYVAIGVNDSTITDLQIFELNVSFLINPNTTYFDTDILQIYRQGFPLGPPLFNLTYINGTGFSEQYDPNNYIVLDTVNSYKINLNSTHLSLIYILYFNANVSWYGGYSVHSWANNSNPVLMDDRVSIGLFTLSRRIPETPGFLFGAGFNASPTGYILNYWNGSMNLVEDFEIQNSSDGISWGILATPATQFYNDTSAELTNGTCRFYRVRARRLIDGDYYNSSWSETNLERVYFTTGAAAGAAEDTFSFFFLIIGMSLMILTTPLTKMWIEEND